jgi:hypothetical protein
MLVPALGYAYGMAGRQNTTRRILTDIERRSRTEYFPKNQISFLQGPVGRDGVRDASQFRPSGTTPGARDCDAFRNPPTSLSRRRACD